jgi:hypothetical protein
MAEYKDLTDEEYDALDEELTRTVPKLGPDGTGWLAQRELRLMGLSNMTVNYLFTTEQFCGRYPYWRYSSRFCHLRLDWPLFVADWFAAAALLVGSTAVSLAAPLSWL